MSLVSHEFKKILTPLTVIALFVMLLVNMYICVQYHKEYLFSDCAVDVLKSEFAEKRGEINDEWIAARYDDANEILNKPEYLKTEAELKAYLDELRTKGYPESEIEALKDYPYTVLNDAGVIAYDNVTKLMSAAGFRENAERQMNWLLEEYADDESICADIEQRYGYLKDEYAAYCDYDFAYVQIQYAVSNAFPFSVGIPVLIGLASLFAVERSRKTDALILSTKHGRAKVARAKLCAGLGFAAAVWLIMATSVIAYSFILYGADGFSSYWQSFADITAPFAWTVGRAVVAELIASFIGTMLFAAAVMLLSEFSGSTFLCTVLSAALLLTPMFVSIRAGLLKLLPTCLMQGLTLWGTYAPAKLFGAVIPMQYIVLALALILTAVCCLASLCSFTRRNAA